MFTTRKVNKCRRKFPFWEEIFQIQDNPIPNNTKKATELEMKVFRGK